MRSSCSVGADDSLWGAGQVITLLQDVLTDQPGGALAWSILVWVFLGWEGAGADVVRQGPEETGGSWG